MLIREVLKPDPIKFTTQVQMLSGMFTTQVQMLPGMFTTIGRKKLSRKRSGDTHVT